MAVDWIVYKTRLYQRVTSCLCTPLSVLHSLQKQDKRNKDCISDTLLFNRRIYFTERESRFDPRGISSPFPSHKYYSSNANNLKKIVEFSGKNSDFENCAKKKNMTGFTEIFKPESWSPSPVIFVCNLNSMAAMWKNWGELPIFER